MSRIEVVFYQEADGRSPVGEWLSELRRRDARAHVKCFERMAQLAEAGHELRRPASGYLRDSIHELRARRGHVNYRILYFFFDRRMAVLAHALTKEDVVPEADIQLAVERKHRFERNPQLHSHED